VFQRCVAGTLRGNFFRHNNNLLEVKNTIIDLLNKDITPKYIKDFRIFIKKNPTITVSVVCAFWSLILLLWLPLLSILCFPIFLLLVITCMCSLNENTEYKKIHSYVRIAIILNIIATIFGGLFYLAIATIDNFRAFHQGKIEHILKRMDNFDPYKKFEDEKLPSYVNSSNLDHYRSLQFKLLLANERVSLIEELGDICIDPPQWAKNLGIEGGRLLYSDRSYTTAITRAENDRDLAGGALEKFNENNVRSDAETWQKTTDIFNNAVSTNDTKIKK
jgi:hypothetical protein